MLAPFQQELWNAARPELLFSRSNGRVLLKELHRESRGVEAGAGVHLAFN